MNKTRLCMIRRRMEVIYVCCLMCIVSRMSNKCVQVEMIDWPRRGRKSEFGCHIQSIFIG